MSCISEILNLKGDKEFLVLGNPKGFHAFCIENGGEYKGYEYLITMVGRGHRCGYVAIPEDKPINDKGVDYDFGYDVHGGITFCDRDHPAKAALSIACTDLWLGFDAAHGHDCVDLVCAEKYFGETQEIKYMKTNDFYRGIEFGEIRTFEYMESECKKLIDQLVQQQAGS